MRLTAIPTAAAEQRRRYYQQIDAHHLAPLWEVLDTLVPHAPQSPAVPAVWRYAQIRGALMEAGDLISAQEAERRVLVLENPAMRGRACITQSLYAGLQLILPGEVAPSHRHSQSALRLVLEGEGAYTAVDGERTTMHRGDFIVTPSNAWHDHGNPGRSPVVWLDGLDIPLVRFLDAGFAEKGAHDTQSITRPEGDSVARYGSNMVPVDFAQQPHEPSRVFVYPYATARRALFDVACGRVDPHFGHKLRYVNPATGASPMPTIGTFLQLLPPAFETRPYRSTDGAVFTCLEGEGVVEIAGQTFPFAENDVFVVPSWQTYRLQTRRAAILFSFSDRPVQQVLGLWREEKL